MNPKKFSLWLFLVSLTMLFAGLTSAVVVKRADNNWLEFHIPTIFMINTVVIVLSSITMQWSYYSAKKNNLKNNRIALWLTVILGIAFIVGQVMGYQALIAEKTFLVGREINGVLISNPSASFFYVISGLHALHLFGGVIALAFTIYASYNYRVHSMSLVGINLCATYWHYMGALWVYLFVFLNLIQ